MVIQAVNRVLNVVLNLAINQTGSQEATRGVAEVPASPMSSARVGRRT